MVEVVEEDYMENSPLAACEDCRKKWEESGVENSSYKVKWEELISWDIKYEEVRSGLHALKGGLSCIITV